MASSPHSAMESPLVVASNRGPVRFERDEQGKLVAHRGSGGASRVVLGRRVRQAQVSLGADDVIVGVHSRVADRGRVVLVAVGVGRERAQGEAEREKSEQQHSHKGA